MRPHRLAWPRTPPFHGGDRGSNPLGDAIKIKHPVTILNFYEFEVIAGCFLL